MKLQNYNKIIYIFIILSGQYSFSAGGSFATSTSKINDSIPSASTTSTNNQVSVSDTAKQIENSNSSGAQTFAQISTALGIAGSICAASCNHGGCCPKAPILFAMSALASMQSGANSGTAGGARDMYNDSFCPGCNGVDPTDPYNRKAANGKYGNDILNRLATDGINGFKLSPDGQSILGPDGKKYDVKNYSSPGAMAAAGLSKATIDDVMSIAAKAEKDAIKKIGAHTAANGYAEGGGAGSGSTSQVQQEDPFVGYGTAKPEAYKRDVAGQNVAGLTKNFNGEPIGVAADDIFTMMKRRYKVKEQQDNFYHENEAIKK